MGRGTWWATVRGGHKESDMTKPLTLCSVWEDTSLWAHWIHSFHMHLSCLGPKPVSWLFTSLNPFSSQKAADVADGCFLDTPSSSAVTMRGSDICRIAGIVFRFGSPHLHLEVRNHWWLCRFLPIDMAGQKTRWKRPWCWERLRARGQGGNGGCNGWMASSTQWTWVWASSGS